MIEEVDNFIVSRLSLIKIDGEPVKVFAYEPTRDRGDAEFPCITVLRMEHTINNSMKRFGIEEFESSTEVQVYQKPGGGSYIGPDHFTVRPYPTPIDIKYMLDVMSTDKSTADFLLHMMFQAFPPGYQPKIGNQYPLFIYGKPVNRDVLHIPMFRTTYMMGVLGFMLDRLESYEVKPMADILFDKQINNYALEN